MFSTFIAGLGVGFSLIIAIGAQNAFVLRQGLRGEYVGAVSFTCAFSDAVLISIGIAGFGWITAQAGWVIPVFRYVGAGFLFLYGGFAFYRALKSKEILEEDSKSNPTSSATTITICLALTWLNPHVYLDTVILIGSISTGFSEKEWVFGLGAISASFIFFYTLGYGARYLRPIFKSHQSWQILDIIIGIIMCIIAIKLIFEW